MSGGSGTGTPAAAASSLGWVTLAEANDYFGSERLETTYWDALTATTGGKDEKSVVLLQAYNRLYYSKDFTLPTLAAASAAELVILKKAQCEMGYYLAQHSATEDRRKGLQAQGVVAAGVVKETYKDSDLGSVPIPSNVRDLLNTFSSAATTPLFAVDIDRDEDEATDYDPTDL